MASRTPPVYDPHHSSAANGRPHEFAPTGYDNLPLPLVLQSSASKTVTRHVARGLRRLGVLLVADTAVLGFLRDLVHAVRERAMIGQDLATAVGRIVRVGLLPPVEMVSAVILGLAVFGNYSAGDRRRDPRRIVAGSTLGISLIAWGHLWAEWSIAALLGYAIVVTLAGAALALGRSILDWCVAGIRKGSIHSTRTLVVGVPSETARLGEYRGLLDRAEFNIVGTRAITDESAFGRELHRERIETVVFMGSLDRRSSTKLVRTAESAGCQVFRVPEAPPEFEPQLVWRRGTPLLQLTRPGLRGQQLVLKRIFDIGLAGALLVAVAPLMGVIALLIRISSNGPVVFRQIRVGRGGRRFQIHKFRTMVFEAEQLRDGVQTRSVYADPRLFKIPNDPRVTRVGRFLRRSSLDELPQLWDVLRGRMSLVGPRPPLPSEVALYEEAHYLRFDMKPGITGPWQVSGRNRVTDFEEVMRIEAEYMRDWTILKDFVILARTVPAVLKMDGAH